MKTNYALFISSIVAVIILIVVARLVPFTESNRIQDMEVRLKVAEQMAIEKGASAIKFKKQAAAMQPRIDSLINVIANRKPQRHEKTAHIALLPADSLGGLVADQLNELDTTWY